MKHLSIPFNRSICGKIKELVENINNVDCPECLELLKKIDDGMRANDLLRNKNSDDEDR